MAETSYGLVLGRRAVWGLNEFPPEDQARIRSAFGHLIGPMALEKLGRRVRQLPTEEPLYSFRVTPDLRIIFSRQGDMITIVDFVRRATLEALTAGSVPKVAVDERGSEPPRETPKQPDLSRTARRTESRRGPRQRRRQVGHAE